MPCVNTYNWPICKCIVAVNCYGVKCRVDFFTTFNDTLDYFNEI